MTQSKKEKAYQDWYEEVSQTVEEPRSIYITANDLENPAKRFTYADYLRLPETGKIMEIIDGIMSIFSAPASCHVETTTNLTGIIYGYLKQHHGKCKLFHNPFDVRLPLNGATEDEQIVNVVQPDVCIICDPSKIDRQGCLGAPDMIAEVLSPSNKKRDLITKFNLYESAGVTEYWIIDAQQRSVITYIFQNHGKYNNGTLYKYGGKTSMVPVHTLKGLKISLCDLFEN